jgi:hypothetical protein
MSLTWLYVATVYGGGVWLARRAAVEIPWRIALFFFALVLVFMFVPLTYDDVTNAAVDYTAELPPWSHLGHKLSSNPHLNDLTLQLVPWAHGVREQWRSGRIPLWNHSAGGGYPLLANAQSAALSPLRILALPLSLAASLTAEAAWKILIALTFTFLFCRRRYGDLPSCIAAICYGFGGFIVVWLHYPHATVAAFAPAVLWDIDRLAERITPRRFAFSATMWAAILYGGHPETAAHLGFIAIVAVAWIVVVERTAPPRLIGVVAGSITAGALLAAPFIFPFLETIRKSLRYEIVSAAPPPAAALSDWSATIAMLQPHFFGRLPIERPWGPAIPETICGFVSATAVACGFAMAAYVVMGRRWRSREAFFVVATIVAIGIVYGWPGVSDGFHLVFRYAANGRLRFMLALFVAIQAAAATDLALRGVHRPLLIGIGTATVLYASMLAFPFPTTSHRDTAVLALLPAFAVLGAMTFAVITPRWRYAALMLVLVVTIGDSWRVLRDWNPTLPAHTMYRQTPMIRRLIALRNESASPFRIVGYGSVVFPNIAAMYGLEDVRTHDPMAGGRYLALLQVVAGVDRSAYFAMWWNRTTSLLDYLNAKYYVMSPGNELDGPRFRLIYDANDGRIFENRSVLPRFFAVENVILDFDFNTFVQKLSQHTDWAHTALLDDLRIENDRMRRELFTPRPSGSARAAVTLTTSEPTRYAMGVTAPRYTLVVSSIPLWPGWKVTRNGERVHPIRVNGVFLGFAVPAGTWDVRVWYSPASFWMGVWVAAGTMVALIWSAAAMPPLWLFRKSGG